MNELALLIGATGGVTQPLYSDDVFQTVVRTGTGSTATITTGFQPDLVWTKARSGTFGAEDHQLFDSARGAGYMLASNATAAQTYIDGVTGFLSTGYQLGIYGSVNSSTTTYVDWVFAKKAKFFDCGTYTGNGVAGRQIPHSLGVAPGMVIVKQTNSVSGWFVYFRAGDIGFYNLYLNMTNSGSFNALSGKWTADYFMPGEFNGSLNTNGASYVWYAFAHDPSADGIVQCGSFTTDGSGNATVNLGWEPQYVMFKALSTTGGWFMADSMRGWCPTGTNGTAQRLYANTSAAEAADGLGWPTATGFQVQAMVTSSTYIYLAIRRPNKPPTTGTQVYNAIASTGVDGGQSTITLNPGFVADLSISQQRQTSANQVFTDRLRGWPNGANTVKLLPYSTNDESSSGTNLVHTVRQSDGSALSYSLLATGQSPAATYINHFFRRAPGVFDVVCWTSTGSTNRSVSHNLGSIPEMIVMRRRDSIGNWGVYHSAIGQNSYTYLNGVDTAYPEVGVWPTGSTSSVVQINESTFGFGSGARAVVYLFASSPGISKVGSYTGNGSSQTIDCGFSTGCRFFLVKATSTTGNWWLYDSVRGIVSATDFALALNSTAAEVTSTDSVDPISVGIIVNQEATCSINANGVSYIYLAYA